MTDLEILRAAPGWTDGRPPLLFVHGAWHGAWCWADHWLPWFAARGWTCAAVSLRGHGGSAGPRSLRRTPAAAYLDDVHTAAATLPHQPVLIGHSLGGYLVARLLEADVFPAAVLLAPVPSAGSLPALLRGLREVPAAILGSAAALDARRVVGSADLARHFLFSPSTPRVTLRHAFERLNDESMRVVIETALIRPNAARIRASGVPLRVVAAGDDGLFTPAEQQRTAREYGAAFQRVPGGHDMMLDFAWEQAARAVEGWLRINVVRSGVKVR